MANQEVYMDVPKVMEMGKTFETIGETLEKISNTLEALMTVLKATAFIGFFGNALVARYIEQLKPPIDKLAKQCTEIGGDLAASARAYENGDTVGGTRFH